MAVCRAGGLAGAGSPRPGRAPMHEAARLGEGPSCGDASGCARLRCRGDGGQMLQRSTGLAGPHGAGGVWVARCPGHAGGSRTGARTSQLTAGDSPGMACWSPVLGTCCKGGGFWSTSWQSLSVLLF